MSGDREAEASKPSRSYAHGSSPFVRARSSSLDELPEPPAWMGDALCAQTDPEAFFPEKGGSTADAKRVCASCLVAQQCLEYALANGETFGIWGGRSAKELRKLRANR